MKHTQSSRFSGKSLRSLAIIVSCMIGAFVLGIRSSGDIEPLVGSINADGTVVEGDMDANGSITATDARIALEIAHGYRTAGTQELAADPNHDFHITVDDALAIVQILELQ